MAVNQLKAGAMLNYVVLLLNTLVNLLYTPYMLRMMGQSEYGLFSLVSSVIAYITILDLGFGNAIVRYTAKYRAEGKLEEQYQMFGMFLVLYFVIGIIALCIGLSLYFNVDNMFGKTLTPFELSNVRIMMLVLVINLAITFPMSIFGSIMTAYERFVFPKIVNIVRIILNTAIMILLLYMGYKAVAMVIVLTAFNIITLILNFIYCKKYLKIRIAFGHFRWGFLKEVSIYSLWIFLNVIMDKLYWSSGQFVLGAISGAVAVSVFAVAIHLQGMYMQFSTAISSVFLPKVTAIVSKNNSNKEISDLFIKTGRIQNIILSFVLFCFIVFGKPFLILWAGKTYSSAFIITLLFFIALYIPLIQNMGITILQARNSMKFRSILYILIACFALFFEIILAKRFGGLGCAIAIAGALILGQGIIMNIYYKKTQNIDIETFWKEILKMNFAPVLLTAVFSIIVLRNNLITNWISLASYSAIFIMLYLPLIYKYSMNSYERSLFNDIINKVKNRYENFKTIK